MSAAPEDDYKPPRGLKTMEEIVERFQPLAQWMRCFRPGVARMCVARDDFDYIRRWPNIASILDLIYVDGVIEWRGMELYPDAQPPTRYIIGSQQRELPE